MVHDKHRIPIKINFKQITRVKVKFIQYSEGDYISCMTSRYFHFVVHSTIPRYCVFSRNHTIILFIVVHIPIYLYNPCFSGIRITRFLVLCVMFCRMLLVLLSVFCGHCIVCSSSIYRCWLPLWYLQWWFALFDSFSVFTGMCKYQVKNKTDKYILYILEYNQLQNIYIYRNNTIIMYHE
jgi:hypothetical protein